MLDNPYAGVNAHLNSLLQTPDTGDAGSLWSRFHEEHIAQMVEALNGQLPDAYVAVEEESLQAQIVSLRGVVIREVLPGKVPGEVKMRLEVISPQSKGDEQGAFHEIYETNRLNTFIDAIPLVEIDYLHETPSIIREMPRYPEYPFAYAYAVVVNDMRPFTETGKPYVYGFGACARIPELTLRLAEDEMIEFDLNAVYQHTFQAGRWGERLDYSAAPAHFERYSSDDQKRILDVMAKIDG